jgi:osmotically-inducible protein OsmY
MRDEACQVLQRDGEVDASEIEVTCENSVITQTGTVQDRQ